MGFLREYEYFESRDLLILYFYLDALDKRPALIIRLNTCSLDAAVRRLRYAVNRKIITDELERLYMLLETPHWKSYVTISNCVHRDKSYELF